MFNNGDSMISATDGVWMAKKMMRRCDMMMNKDSLLGIEMIWNTTLDFWNGGDIVRDFLQEERGRETVFQLRVCFEKDVTKQEAMWERQHEFAAEKIYNMCSDLGGFFLKVAQIIGKPDLAPAAWVRRLVTLCDQSPATPYDVIRVVLEKELGQSVDGLFERFEVNPLGSASIAQVQHPGVQELMMTDIRNLQAFALYMQKTDIKFDLFSITKEMEKQVQHPGVQELMMTDIRNLQAFALYMQKTDIKFDLFSITKEMEKQIGYEFDFKREADAMERIRHFLHENNKNSPVMVPRVIRNMVTRRVLVMEYIDGIPILKLGDEIAKRGINPGGKIAAAAKRNILKSLAVAYGQMILKSGFFHADPHPGNILICKGSEASRQPNFTTLKHSTLLPSSQPFLLYTFSFNG
ncbi:hypothetical protein TEA_013201 [Camellia sinensis var. sinensis]|uniref:ABC1 atypical kinase-like domain-containing protein n=1 Tax=Camellia sinensis var. sinensis TaxID=542762 RepID=A0A4V3WPN1_CAMSN|nr:hypothetical protein TEA_013201 [Camellia sinensis var. sinensis]